MFCVGLTGGIGSGKSTVANMFAALGVPIIDADVIARELAEPDKRGFEAVIKVFGPSILTSDHQLNRKKLRELIFKNPQARQLLEQILHPLIAEEMKRRLQALQASYCMAVIPLLAETTQAIDFLDRVCVVEAPKEMRLHWASIRDKVDAAEIATIMDTQASREQRLKIADDIIENNQSLSELQKQVLTLHEKYLQLSGNGKRAPS